jgi:hypothetical protein
VAVVTSDDPDEALGGVGWYFLKSEGPLLAAHFVHAVNTQAHTHIQTLTCTHIWKDNLSTLQLLTTALSLYMSIYVINI